MPGHLLDFVRFQASPKAFKPLPSKNEAQIHTIEALDFDQRRDSMDLFHHHKDKDGHEKRKSIAGKATSGGKNSPMLAAHKPAKLDIEIESPPLVCHGPPRTSTGALMSGQLVVEVVDEEVKLNRLEMKLVGKVVARKPIVKDCNDCANKNTDLKYWNFFTEPRTLKKGIHRFPFSYLLSGCLPATSENKLGSIQYVLNAWSMSDFFENLKVQRVITLMRALPPSPDHNSIRVFPPTKLTATVVMPQHFYPIGEFPIHMRMTGTVEIESEYYRHWVVKTLKYRIDEHSKMVSPPCSKHLDKLASGKGVLNQDIRSIGEHEDKEGWKNDFDAAPQILYADWSRESPEDEVHADLDREKWHGH